MAKMCCLLKKKTKTKNKKTATTTKSRQENQIREIKSILRIIRE
jgi:hypothetical protein